MTSFPAEFRVLVDFDGTIVPGDVTDHILQSFASPEWLKLETEWQAGRMNSRDCLGAQVALIRASRADIYRCVHERPVDPGFLEFAELCHVRAIPVTIVSDGFDLAIEATLERYGLDLPYFSNRLKSLGDMRWRLEFPHRNSDCKTEAGNCKCRQLAVRPVRTVVIGDGRSDFCVSSNADYVLSKASLTEHCTRNNVPHRPFIDFSDVIANFDSWVREVMSVQRGDHGNLGKAQRLPSLPASATGSTKMTPQIRQPLMNI